MYSSDVKKCAKQIVKEAFDQILTDSYRIPSEVQMESYVRENIEYSFSEYQVTQRIVRSHPDWALDQVAEELERQKMRYDKEYNTHLKQASQAAITEVENLIKNLKETIKSWKIIHLA